MTTNYSQHKSDEIEEINTRAPITGVSDTTRLTQTYTGVTQSQTKTITHTGDPDFSRQVFVYTLASGSNQYDTSLDFDLVDEGQFVQEQSGTGTLFVGGKVTLGGTVGAGNDSNTKLLIHSDTTNGSVVFQDSSGSSHTITPYGHAQHSTASAKFGATSMYYDAGGDDYISIPDHNNFDLSDKTTWTMDFWVNTTKASYSNWFGHSGSTDTPTNYDWYMGLSAAGNLIWYTYNGSTDRYVQKASPGVADGNWHHIAVVRNGNDLALYIDGTNVNLISTMGTYTGKTGTGFTFGMGRWSGHASGGWRPFQGYFDEFRFSHVARWTSNFTPDTSPYGGVSYTTAQPYYVTTSDTNHIDLTDIDIINSCTISGATPANTSIKALVSFDGRTTWKKWGGSSWATHTGGLANLQTGNTIAEIQSGFSNFDVTDESYIDFAFDLSTTNSGVTPEIDQIELYYTEVGTYTLANNDFTIAYPSSGSTTVTKNSSGVHNIKVIINI